MRLHTKLAHLILCAALVAGCSDSPVIPPDPNEALLTDKELATPADPAEVTVDPAWDLWIRDHHFTIRSLTSQRNDDLQFLKSVIGSRRLVQLGESGHGVREFNLAKVRLIRFLHEEMGFDVIAFESGLFDCWKANELAADPPATTMGRCIFGVWSTDEVIQLFEYLRETRSTSRPLILAGVDIQLTGGTSRRYAADFLAEVIGRVDPAYASRVRELEETFHPNFSATASRFPFDLISRANAIAELDAEFRFTARYDSLMTFINANSSKFAAAYPGNPEKALLAWQMAWTRVQLMSYLG